VNLNAEPKTLLEFYKTVGPNYLVKYVMDLIFPQRKWLPISVSQEQTKLIRHTIRGLYKKILKTESHPSDLVLLKCVLQRCYMDDGSDLIPNFALYLASDLANDVPVQDWDYIKLWEDDFMAPYVWIGDLADGEVLKLVKINANPAPQKWDWDFDSILNARLAGTGACCIEETAADFLVMAVEHQLGMGVANMDLAKIKIKYHFLPSFSEEELIMYMRSVLFNKISLYKECRLAFEQLNN